MQAHLRINVQISQEPFQNKSVTKGKFIDIFHPVNLQSLVSQMKGFHCADYEWNRNQFQGKVFML